MPSKFDDLLDEMLDAGVDEEYITRLREASSGSPLRRERDAAVQRADELETRTKALEETLLNATFEKLGIKVKPGALRLPDDVDILDEEKLRTWAVEHGLAEPPPPDTPEEEQAAHERVAAATTGAGAGTAKSGVITPADTADWPVDRLMAFRKQHPDEFEALKRGETVTVTP